MSTVLNGETMTVNITNDYFAQVGFGVEPAPVDAWRQFDEQNPAPGYFQFDWFSSYHPDLYQKFALSTEGLMDELEKMVDLSGLTVADIGAGTGRSTRRLAQKASHVLAIDAYSSTLNFSRRLSEDAGINNITYRAEDCFHISLADNTVDASVSAWAVWDQAEAYRITKPGGYLIFMGCAPNSLCGELTATLAAEYPHLIEGVAPAEVYDVDYPAREFEAGCTWNDVPLTVPLRVREFTYVSDYEHWTEAAAIYGRLYGPKASAYFQERKQSTVSWRLCIWVGQVAK